MAGDETCPSCGSTQVLPIVYGMPLADEYERLQGEVVFAGCCVPDPAPSFACGVCTARWGEPTPSARDDV